MKHLASVVIHVAFAVTAFSAQAQTTSTNAADTDFVRRASSAGLTEIALGKLAATQASSDDVKKFAARMVADHTKSNEDLGKLAGSKGVQIAIAPEPAQQQLIDRMKDLEGARFDREYADAAVRDHKLTSGLYELEATKGQDVEIREFARKSLPMLKEHENLADSLPPF
jgi:putative membrane protein